LKSTSFSPSPPSDPFEEFFMSISRLKTTLLASALALAGTANAATTVLNEGFSGSLSDLSAAGWLMTNLSSPAGSTTWFRPADTDIFAAQDGSANYIAANYNSGVAGGTVDNWLITPTFSTAASGTIDLWIRSAADAGYTDTVKFGFSTGSASPASFVTGLKSVINGGWTQYSFAFDAAGAGSTARFAIEYVGAADVLDQIGIDSLTITSSAAAVPEPTNWALFAAGAGVLVCLRRRQLR